MRDQQLADIKIVLSEESGRRFVWRLLEHARVFESIYEMNAKIHYNAGMQDFGHFIMAEIVEADPNRLIEMMIESKKRGEKVG